MGDYKNGLFDCFGNCGLCVITYFLPVSIYMPIKKCQLYFFNLENTIPITINFLVLYSRKEHRIA